MSGWNPDLGQIGAWLRGWSHSVKGRLELHFLPGYAPDLNPDEFVWNHLRQNDVTKKPLKTNERLKDRIEKDLAKIKRSPRLVRSFFRTENVVYITD